MRILGLTFLAGCSLYFGNGTPPPQDDVAPPDVDGGSYSGAQYYCEGTTVYETDDGNRADAYVSGTCPYGCGITTTLLPNPPVCLQPQPTVYTCSTMPPFPCTDGEQLGDCSAPLQCGQVVSTGTCSCDAAGNTSCVDACNGGLCGAAAVQAAIADDWSGTVTPPSFAAPYRVDLQIGNGGLWRATGTGQLPFYYGDNGNNLGSRIVVQAQTTTGAYASIGLFDGEVQGLITGLTIDGNHMTFAFVDSWLSCSRTFYFDLYRLGGL